MTNEKFQKPDPTTGLMTAIGFDKAIMGVTERNGAWIVVYCVEAMLGILVEEHEMTPDEALEYFEFNIEGAYVGDFTPIFVHTTDLESYTNDIDETNDTIRSTEH